MGKLYDISMPPPQKKERDRHKKAYPPSECFCSLTMNVGALDCILIIRLPCPSLDYSWDIIVRLIFQIVVENKSEIKEKYRNLKDI